MLANPSQGKVSGNVIPKGSQSKANVRARPSQPKMAYIVDMDTDVYKKGSVRRESSATLEEIKVPEQAVLPGMLVLPKLEPVKFAPVDHPFTTIGKGLQGFHFIKEYKDGKFLDKKIAKPTANATTAMSTLKAESEKDMHASSSPKTVAKPLTDSEILNFMTVTYVAENKALMAGGIDPSLSKISSKACYLSYREGYVEELPDMNQPRYSHAALLMGTDGVLVAGGRTYGKDPECILDSAEFLDIPTQCWRLLPARCQFELCLHEGKAYALGGLTDSGMSTDSIERFDDGANRWVELRIRLPQPMDSFRVIPGEQDYSLLLVGGRRNLANAAEVVDFSIADGSYLHHSRMNAARNNPKVLRLEGDFVVLGGGVLQTFAERFDRARNQWVVDKRFTGLTEVLNSVGTIDYASMLTTSTVVKSSRELQDVGYEEVDWSLIDTNALSPEEISRLMEKKKKADMMREKERRRKEDSENAERLEALENEQNKKKVLPSVDGLIFVFGDDRTPFSGYVDVAKLQSHPMRVPNHLRLFPNLRIHRLLDKTCLLYDEGTEDSFPREEIIHFDPYHWTFKPLPRRTKRVYDSHVVQVSPDRVYFVGGKRRTAQPLLSNHLESFSFKQKKWQVHASMAKTRLKPVCYAWGGAIFVVGGANNDNEVESSIERYDPQTNAWTTLDLKFTTAVYDGLPIVRRSDVLVLGGLTRSMLLDTVYAVSVLPELPPQCAFVKNLPLLKSVSDASFIDLGTSTVILYSERNPLGGPGRRVARFFDLESLDFGPELPVDVAAQLARLGVSARQFG